MVSLPDLELETLAFWRREDIFDKSLKLREKGEKFIFFDGPPFATGLPHYGHILASVIKDVVLRFKTMKGFDAPRRFGWDTHGLPVENEIEKQFELLGADQIEAFGIERFNEECRGIVERYTKEWRETIERIGRWVDFEHEWRTMDPDYMESVWGVFGQLWNKGHVYQGYRVMPYSWKLGTPLSNFEAGENYKEVDDPSLFVAFETKDDPGTYFVAWTTTPWTLVSNLALMVHPDAEYVKVRVGDKHYILSAESRLFDEVEIVGRYLGKELEGRRYRPLFDYFADRDAFRVLLSKEVSLDDGTGVVHSAPAFGELDFFVCQEAGIELVCPVDDNGRFTDEVPEYTGQFVKDADKAIVQRLKDQLIKVGTIHHRYPFCWRSDTPLIYKAVSTWFVRVDRERMVKANAQIHWTPEHLKEGRFGKWLANARDWNIARNRYWGTPIPLWVAEDGEVMVVSSVAELESMTGAKVTDLHRHFIDDLVIEREGKKFRRIPEVFDCWFEAGSMPYATGAAKLPADFIAEGLDQTRGWFYTLTILASLLHDKPAFLNVIVNGLLLAEDGQKMSKRLRNYPAPSEVLEKYGADAVRMYLLHSPAVHADDLRFSERGVELTMRQILLPLWNAYSFFSTYAGIYDWKGVEEGWEPKQAIDRWMISELSKLIGDVERGMDEYQLAHAVEPFIGFVDKLTNWFIRLNRRRFWESEDGDAFATLYTVLKTLVIVAAPFIPFLSDAIYRKLGGEGSVHLCDYPQVGMRDVRLEAEMAVAQRAVSLGHALRKEHKIKVRQPLRRVHIASGNPEVVEFLQDQKHLIAAELNVKEVEISGDESGLVRLVAKPNFRVLGKKVGGRMPAMQAVINGFDQEQLSVLRSGETLTIDLEGEPWRLEREDVLVEREVREGLQAANEGNITVALDTQIDEELRVEALARELVNKVSTMRRDADLDYTARIRVEIESTPRVQEAFEAHADYVQHELLAVQVDFVSCDGQEWDLNGESAKIAIHGV